MHGCCFGRVLFAGVIKLNTSKWDILATGAIVYFDCKLGKLKLQTYQSIIPAKVREKPPDNVQNRENGMWREGKFPSLAENAVQQRKWTTFSDVHISDNRNSRNQVLGLVTSQATEIFFTITAEILARCLTNFYLQ